MSGAEYHTALKGQSWKLRLMNTIDECMKYAADKDAFVSLMESEGYAVRWESGRKYITYTTPDGMRCRDNKLHEEKYCKEAMEHEFRIRAELVQRKFHRAAEIDGGIEADESAEQRTAAATQPQTIQPIVIQCDLPQAMNKLTEQADGINWELEEIRKTLPELKTRIDLTPVQQSLTEMQKSLTEMNKLLERVGNLSEKYSSKWIDWLPDFSLLVALKWIMLVLILGTAALAGWYGAAAIRSLFLLYPRRGGAGCRRHCCWTRMSDAEEQRRRMEAKIAAENFGAVIGFAAGAAMAVKEKLDEHAAQEGTEKATAWANDGWVIGIMYSPVLNHTNERDRPSQSVSFA